MVVLLLSMDLVGKKINFKVQKNAADNDTPVLLSFPAGVPNDASSADLMLWRKKSSSKVKQTLACDAEGVLYRGSDYGASNGASADAYNYAVGVYDKTNHTMTLVPAHHPFAMNRVPTIEANSSAVSDMTAWERRAALTEEFGSRKRKRAARAAESNIISIENISGAAVVKASMTDRVDAAHEDSNITSAAQVALSDQRLQLLPAFNEYATELSEAYPMQSLMPIELRNSIAEFYDKKQEELSTENIALNNKEEWVSHFIPACSGDFVNSLIPDNICQTMGKHKKTCKSRTCELLYLNMLLNFYTAMNKSSSVKKEEIITKYSMPVEALDYIAQNFAIIKKIRGEDGFQKNRQNRFKI